VSRKSLITDIAALDASLQSRRKQIAVTSRRGTRALQQHNPCWLMAAGVTAGVVVGSLGWRSTYAAGMAGYRLFPLARGSYEWLVGLGEEV